MFYCFRLHASPIPGDCKFCDLEATYDEDAIDTLVANCEDAWGTDEEYHPTDSIEFRKYGEFIFRLSAEEFWSAVRAYRDRKSME